MIPDFRYNAKNKRTKIVHLALVIFCIKSEWGKKDFCFQTIERRKIIINNFRMQIELKRSYFGAELIRE